MSREPRYVVKIGSNSLVDAAGRIDPDLIAGYAAQLAALVASGWTLLPVVAASLCL